MRVFDWFRSEAQCQLANCIKVRWSFKMTYDDKSWRSPEPLSTAHFRFISPLWAFEVSFTSWLASEIKPLNDTSKMHLPQSPHSHPPFKTNNRCTTDIVEYKTKNHLKSSFFSNSALNADCWSNLAFLNIFHIVYHIQTNQQMLELRKPIYIFTASSVNQGVDGRETTVISSSSCCHL